MINIIRRAGKIWLLGGLILMIIFWLNLGGWDKDSFGKRMTLNKAAVEMVKENLWLGVGAGNFLVKLPKYQQNGPYWWQPVHNIPLLIISEIGILGVMEIGWILMKVTSYELRANIKKNWVVIGVILITGLVDHYWVTLPQNSWLLVVVLATMG